MSPPPRALEARSYALAAGRPVRISRSIAPPAPLAPSIPRRAVAGSRRRSNFVVVLASTSSSPSSSTSTPSPRLAADNLPPLRVVVTGGSKGIGRALVEGFLSAGDDVAFCSRDAGRVAEAERELRAKFSSNSSSRIFSAPCDVSRPGDARRFAAEAVEALGGIDVWINNAGMSTWGSLAGKDRKKGSETSMNDDDPMTCDEEEIAAVVATNVTGTILGTRAAILALSQQPDGTGGGHIFNMDGAGSTGTATPGFAAYGASKLAISSLHKSVKAELKEASTSSSSKKIDSIALHRLSPGMCTTDLLMKGASRPKAKFFVNVLAEPPEASASFLVPRVREIARKPPSSGPDNAPSAAFLTPVKALGLLLARVTTGARKDRFLVEE